MSNQFTVSIEPSHLSFTVSENENILNAAKRQGINLPHSCQGGFCSACKVQMRSGTIVHGEYDTRYALTDEEAASGKILTCRATAHSDLVIDLPGYTAEDLKQQMYTVSVASVDYIDGVAIIRLNFPDKEHFIFEAGQYIDVVLQDNQVRSYSIANAAVDDCHFIELHIRAQKEGLFTNYVFNHMQAGHTLQIRGALGSFTLKNPDSKKPVIFLASGTGFAPVKSMLETIISRGLTDRTIYFYWGARQKEDLYLLEKAQAFSLSLPRYHFVPVLSDSVAKDNWTGRTGLVHEAVLQDFNDLGFYEVYACGALGMIEAAVCSFTKNRHLPETAFYSDAFIPSC